MMETVQAFCLYKNIRQHNIWEIKIPLITQSSILAQYITDQVWGEYITDQLWGEYITDQLWCFT